MIAIDLRSDTVTRPSKEMRRAMYDAEVGDDVFGDDPTVNKLQEKVADLLGKERALFVPSGTMANQIAIKIHTVPGDEVFCEAGSHIFNYESGAPAFISGVQVHPIPGERGVFTAEQLEERLRSEDHHFPPGKLVVIENTHNRSGGKVWPVREVRRLSGFAKENGMAVHLDGARLWNAAAASGISEREWAKFADTVSVCFSKGLGAPIGSCIAGPEELIEEAHRFRKRLGGGMRQVGLIAAAALYAVEHNRGRLVEDHRRAKNLAKGLAEISGFSIDLDHLDSNIIILDMSERGLAGTRFASAVAARGMHVTLAGKYKVRLVTHLDIDDDKITNALNIVHELYG